MKNLYLKDIINLTKEELNTAKITLNMTIPNSNDKPIDLWEQDGDVSYAYWSHYGKQRNFTSAGQLSFGFVQLKNNNKKWLLVTVGKITDIPNTPDFCEYEELEKYSGLCGRLIVKLDKGNTYARYAFNLNKYIDEIVVDEILPQEYKTIEFNGYDNVHFSYKDLISILKCEKYTSYKKLLAAIKGVYCLTDTNNGKLYIGSAYGSDGIAQRWENYLDTQNGGNKSLVELYNTKGDNYFKEHFEFTLIEFFGTNTSNEKIIERETYWKNAFSSRGESGYNKN